MTFVIIDGWTVTVASVGDSRCILDSQGGVVSLLTVDHRLEENVEERERVTASGGEVGRLNVFGGNEVWCTFYLSLMTCSDMYFILPLLPSCFYLMCTISQWFVGWSSALLARWIMSF